MAEGVVYWRVLDECSFVSAEGARYESEGQAPNNVRRVAPG